MDKERERLMAFGNRLYSRVEEGREVAYQDIMKTYRKMFTTTTGPYAGEWNVLRADYLDPVIDRFLSAIDKYVKLNEGTIRSKNALDIKAKFLEVPRQRRLF